MPVEIKFTISDNVMKKLKEKGIAEEVLKEELEEIIKVIDRVKPRRVPAWMRK